MIHFNINRSVNNQYYWTLVANNGQILCNSETYTTKQNAINSADAVRKCPSDTPIYDNTK